MVFFILFLVFVLQMNSSMEAIGGLVFSFVGQKRKLSRANSSA
ncbi:hypothetical protein C804_05424 [Lachnospiraceae bacterium A4]|nr:hypothetical protein C804_05424 [Lachnospiraceae bacterium A4]